MKRLAWWLAVLVAAVVAAPARADVGDLPDPGFTTNGTVTEVDRDGDDLLLGGYFTRIGRRTGPLVVVDTATGARDARLPEFDWDARAAAPDGAGGWFVQPPGEHDRIGRFTGGTWDAGFDVSLYNAVGTMGVPAVSALERVGDVLYVAGDFDEVNGAARAGLAAVDARTGALLPWAPGREVTRGGWVRSIRVLGDRVYLVGSFDAEEGRDQVVAADRDTGAPADFPLDVNGVVFDLEVTDGRVFVAGSFDRVGDLERRNLAEVDPSTAGPRPFDARLGPGMVWDVAIDSGRGALYLAGVFREAGGEPRQGFAAVGLVTGAPLPWDPRAGRTDPAARQSGRAVAVAGDHVVVTGYDDASAVAAAVDPVTGRDRAWSLRPDDTADRLVAAGDQVVLAGTFAAASSVGRRGLARVRASDGAPTGGPLPAVTGGLLRAIDRLGDVLYLGGDFTRVGGQPRRGLAAVDARTGEVLPWAPEITGGIVALVAGADGVFVGGILRQPDGTGRSIAALDPATAATRATWTVGGGSSGVADLALAGGRLFVAGGFATVAGVPREGVAALDVATGTVSGWDPAPDAPVFGLAVEGDRVYLGGRFDRVGGVERTFAAAVDASTGAPLAWAPDPEGPIRRIAVGGDRVYLAGVPRFSADDLPSDMLTVVDRASGAALARIDPPDVAEARDIVADAGRVVIGGWASAYGRTPAYSSGRGVRAGGLMMFSIRPINLVPPSVPGRSEPGSRNAHVYAGETLTCEPGTWRDAAGEFSYAWRRWDAGRSEIVGTERTRVATPEDAAGDGLVCVVTAARGDQRTEAESNRVYVREREPVPPEPTPRPPAAPAPRPAAVPPFPGRGTGTTGTGAPVGAVADVRFWVVARSPRRLVLRLRCAVDCRVRVRVAARGGRRCSARTYRVRAGVPRTVRIRLRAGGGCRRSGRRIVVRGVA